MVCIFGLNGAASGHRLVNIKVEHIKEYENYYWVVIPNAEIKQSFTITGSFFTIVKRYAALRPKKTVTNRFFLHYSQGKCAETPIGQNQFYKMPRKIAQYLGLPKTGQYSGEDHYTVYVRLNRKQKKSFLFLTPGGSFRIPTATEFLARQSIRINPSSVPMPISEVSNSTKATELEPFNEMDNDQSVEYSLDYETGLMKTSSVSVRAPSVSAASNSNDYTTGNVELNELILSFLVDFDSISHFQTTCVTTVAVA